MKVLIDPGHAPGNANGGKNGYKEFAGMWKIANYLKNALQTAGVTADLTRAENADLSVDKRGAMATGYDLFISQHSNAANGTARGVECFYSLSRPNDKAHAAKLSSTVARLMDSPDRGAKTREIETTKGRDFYGVIRSAISVGCPHVFLIENGFHGNIQDEAFLLNDENLQRIAEVQAGVLLAILGVSGTDAPAKAETIKTPIIGASVLTAEQLETFLLRHNPSPKISCSPLELCRLFIEEGAVLNIRGDIAFCQSMHETGWLRYGGDVSAEQNNYAGIGAVGGGAKGAWFDSPRIGVRAVIHHLYAYATDKPLPDGVECASPRFNLVRRGTAPAWEDLGGKWAVPGFDMKTYNTFEEAFAVETTYGQSILALFARAVESVPAIAPQKSPAEITIDNAIADGLITDHTLARWINGDNCSESRIHKNRYGSGA